MLRVGHVLSKLSHPARRYMGELGILVNGIITAAVLRAQRRATVLGGVGQAASRACWSHKKTVGEARTQLELGRARCLSLVYSTQEAQLQLEGIDTTKRVLTAVSRLGSGDVG